ncbi:MAG: PIG-L deacetylase family protein [Patescibacteria group bacterium]
MNVLIIAPHPDDEVLGCGGTITRHVQRGDSVYLVVVTKTYTPDWSEEFIRNRPKEVEKVNGILGIKQTFFLDFPTVKLDTVPQKELNDALDRIVLDIKPDIAYIPHRGDLNRDHRLIHESSLVALRPTHVKVRRILSYEVLSETEWGFEPFVPNTYIDISDSFDKKIEAMRVYSSELIKYPHPRSIEVIEALAKKRGSECGLKFAEAFMLIREVC